MKPTKFIAALCGVAAFVCSCEKEDSKTNDEGKEPVPVKVASITLSATELKLAPEEEAVLTATFAPEDADLSSVVWASSAEAVATVSQDGKVKAVCQVTVQTPAKEWAVGDYYEVGSVKGVVVWVDESKLKGKIISLDETTADVWSTSNRTTGAQSTTDGKGNTAKVKALDNGLTSFPAFKWCVEKGDGWYLPASDEVKCFLTIAPVINAVLTEHGGTALDSYYWSSTESDSNSETNAYWIYGYNGSTTTNDDSKTAPEGPNFVRAMYQF